MMTQDWRIPMHPNFQWAMEAGVLTWSEARRLSQIPAGTQEDDLDDATAALARRYLYWLKTTDRAQ